jgi:hypothetical protein
MINSLIINKKYYINQNGIIILFMWKINRIDKILTDIKLLIIHSVIVIKLVI